MSFALLVFVILCVPETTGRTLEEISKELAKKWASYMHINISYILSGYLVCEIYVFFHLSFLFFTRKHFEVKLFKHRKSQESLMSSNTSAERANVGPY